jgi:hypothetical protein
LNGLPCTPAHSTPLFVAFLFVAFCCRLAERLRDAGVGDDLLVSPYGFRRIGAPMCGS